MNNWKKLIKDMKVSERNVYVSGGMSGHPNLNYQAFHDRSAALRDAGHGVVNPAELPHPGITLDGEVDLAKCTDYTYFELLSRDFLAIWEVCDTIYLMEGWEKSRGACGELSIARMMGLREVYEITPPNHILDANHPEYTI